MITKFLMLITLSMLVLCTSLAWSAQPGEMTEEQMQQMMEGAQKMQECMAKIDQSAMDALAAKGEKMHAEIKKLCAAGKRDDAQKKAIAYGKEMSSSREMKAMQKCGDMAKQMMQQMPMGDVGSADQGHICDGM